MPAFDDVGAHAWEGTTPVATATAVPSWVVLRESDMGSSFAECGWLVTRESFPSRAAFESRYSPHNAYRNPRQRVSDSPTACLPGNPLLESVFNRAESCD